jgi:hypothetical protein
MMTCTWNPYFVLISTDKILTITHITSSPKFTDRQTGDYNGEPHFLQVNKYAMSTVPHNTDYSEYIVFGFFHVL